MCFRVTSPRAVSLCTPHNRNVTRVLRARGRAHRDTCCRGLVECHRNTGPEEGSPRDLARSAFALLTMRRRLRDFGLAAATITVRSQPPQSPLASRADRSPPEVFPDRLA